MDGSSAHYRPYLMMTLLFVVVLVGTILVLRRPEPAPLTLLTPTPRATSTAAIVMVDVRGAVTRPGVYTLPQGSRLQDALALAGDVLAGAETRGLNLARKLVDGEQVYVPTMAEATEAATAAATASRGRAKTPTPAGRVNINTATIEQLDGLPGIGPALAQRIVDYREQNGSFKRPEDLKKVRGIGDMLFEGVKDLIEVE